MRERERQTDRQTKRERDRDRETEREDRETGRETETERQRQTDRQTDRQRYAIIVQQNTNSGHPVGGITMLRVSLIKLAFIILSLTVV